MKTERLRQLSLELASGPLPGRHVYLWYGSSKALLLLLPAGLVKSLDVTRLMACEERPPTASGEARRRIERALRLKLQELASQLAINNGRQILVVSGTELLARYGIGIVSFYEEYVSDRTIVIFIAHRVTDNSPVLENLPGFVRLLPDTTYRYVLSLLESEDTVVSEEE